MKPFLVALLLLSLISICDAVSLQQVVKLSKLKTSDDVIIKLLHRKARQVHPLLYIVSAAFVLAFLIPVIEKAMK